MAILEIAGVTKRFGSHLVLNDISLSVEAGEVHCLLGENGAGKSTLCNLIFGVHQPDAGLIKYDGGEFRPSGPANALELGIAMVHQHFSLVSNMSVVENLMLGRAKTILKQDWIIQRMQELADEYDLTIDPHCIVGDLSVGERQRIEIIKCLLSDPRLLLLDEPTAVLPPEEVDSLLTVCRKVAESGRGVILVTHKLAEIAKVADRTSVLRQGRIVESVRMEGADMHALVRSMVGRDVKSGDSVLAATLGIISDAGQDAATAAPAAAKAVDSRSLGLPALQLQGLTFQDKDGVTRLSDVHLSVARGEIVGIAGVEGNGQSELGAILAGLLTPTGGAMKIGDQDLTGSSAQDITNAGAGIVPEDRHAVACISELSVAENLFLASLEKFSRFGLLDREKMAKRAASMMTEFDVRATSPNAPMSSLSGGNQQKAVLARELSLDPLIFLLAAQPTRGLDVGAVEAVFNRIRTAASNGLGVLLISSDLNELIAVSDRVAVMYRGAIVGELPADPANREKIGAMMSGHLH